MIDTVMQFVNKNQDIYIYSYETGIITYYYNLITILILFNLLLLFSYR